MNIIIIIWTSVWLLCAFLLHAILTCICILISKSHCYFLQDMCLKICKHILIWVEEQTYWIALRFLILGFELELYSPNEYCMVYWYINVILIKLAEKTHLKMILGNDSGECPLVIYLYICVFVHVGGEWHL